MTQRVGTVAAAFVLCATACAGSPPPEDGGVTVDNIAEVCGAGASAIVSGTGIFKTDSYADTITEMRRRVAGQ